ncbi:D-alanyl-D-alanine carboxypeptidase [Nocardia cyriacigeorgica]|uniref:D-alanyl-D-alanine carboxypeptidase n=1 Tax=Nocardia cyriacigeorgica TaxID=135487 RepID=A0A6P1D5T3_9NOCA|nr:D-alanyl-D-alanine carboxypeptidase family protein [Nocardia cyriacigeorgica]NEW45986.1 D-alanyl-D-alanine carboxypeptidase [Nocardia cyriacigeorgica]NEW58044.1 D-alanyl-D-alanine carboxypeptidase [Nocardia cyriacigeorgica]
MNIRDLRCRAAVALAALLAIGTVAAGAPAIAEPASTGPTTTPFTTPNTDSCPQQTLPPPPIDLSEVPKPGQPTPKPLPVPDPPIGGKRLGECGVVVPKGAPPVPEEISATSWMVSDMATGQVLAAKDPHGRYRPASTIKVLLATVALRTLNLDTVVTGTQADADVDGTRVGIGPGGRYTNRQLMQALIMASGNDAAHAIAAQLGGDDGAVAKMNELARSLHALDTRAATPSGLDGPGMSTSAYDLSLLFREAMTIPLFAELIHTEQIDFPGYPADPRIPDDKDHPGFPVGNDNHLLYNYEGALGGKTGFTDDARQTFVAAAERGGRTLIVTLLKADVLPIRPWEQAARLLDYGFALDADASVGALPGPDTEAEPTAVALAAPPQGSEVGHLAQSQGGPDRDDLRWVLVAGGGIMVLVLLAGARRIVKRR